MKIAIRRMGNSQGVIIPNALLAEIGAKTGDALDMKVERGKIVIAPFKRKARHGWAEASKALADAGQGAQVWPEFGKEGHSDWK